MRRGRHSRLKQSYWTEPQPPRTQERSAEILAEEQEPTKRPPGHKDRKNFCKPNRGPHTPEIVFRAPVHRVFRCQWTLSWARRNESWKPSWICFHEERCNACGKVIQSSIDKEKCPDWHPLTAKEQQSLDIEMAKRIEAQQRYTSRIPPITGPQGYRKPK